jgi:putative membrane protein
MGSTLALGRTLAVAMPLMLPLAAAAQSAGTAPTPTTSAAPMAPHSVTLSATDRTFVEQAAQGGLAEVQMAQLAQEKTQDANIRQFAQQMIDDHTPANQKLAQIATQKGVTAPTDPSAAQQKMLARLQKLDGSKFDHAYITGQLKAHQVMLKLFENEAKNGTDADLKMFAQQTVPVIQKHISMAETDKSSS